ncbi:MAG: hypothetical protein KatS3mg094_258 [Candidatus Parcubacteria bacterium]|nr:MAG: hypothetical protein KatS3mg094_258 [Candidatus Parcubacteria bacterium]
MEDNENLKFKIISSGLKKDSKQDKEKSPNILLENIEKENIKKTKGKLIKNPKFYFIIILGLIFIIGGLSSVYYFLIYKNNKSDRLNADKDDRKDIYEIFTKDLKVSYIETSTLDFNTASANLTISNTNTQSQNNLSNQQLVTSTISTNTISNTNTLLENKTTNSNELNLITVFFKNDNKNTSSVVGQVTSSEINSTQDTSTNEVASPNKNQILDVGIKEITNQNKDHGFIYLNFLELEVNLKELNDESLTQSFKQLFNYQKRAGEIYKINFLFNNEPLSCFFIKNYFLKPSFIEEKFIDSFKSSLSDNDCYILIYYTHTRKFPLLLFKITNDFQIVTFMRLWDKETLAKDLIKTIFSFLPQGNLIRNFSLTEKIENVDYKIFYFDNDYKIIWTIYKNYLIISTSLSAFKYLLKNI